MWLVLQEIAILSIPEQDWYYAPKLDLPRADEAGGSNGSDTISSSSSSSNRTIDGSKRFFQTPRSVLLGKLGLGDGIHVAGG